MSKNSRFVFAIMGIACACALVALCAYSVRAGVAPVTIPIMALVLGPALAATAMVATCSMVAPPARPQAVVRAIDLRSVAVEESSESLV